MLKFSPSSNGNFPNSSEGNEEDAIHKREGNETSRDDRSNVEVVLIQDADGGSKKREENEHLHHVDVVLLIGLDITEHTEAEQDQQAVDELKQRGEEGRG